MPGPVPGIHALWSAPCRKDVDGRDEPGRARGAHRVLWVACGVLGIAGNRLGSRFGPLGGHGFLTSDNCMSYKQILQGRSSHPGPLRRSVHGVVFQIIENGTVHVTAGLVPAIHVLPCLGAKDVDARHKAGEHDGLCLRGHFPLPSRPKPV